ncbi:MAG: hypothetical protein ACOYYS_27100 [Chloroflexota bacterium]
MSQPQKKLRFGAIVWAMVLGLVLVFVFLQSAQATSLQQEQPPEDPHMPEAVQASLAVTTLVDTPREDNLVRPGGSLTFTIRYTNTTGGSIANVIISDTLGKGQVYHGVYLASDPSIQYQRNGPLAMEWTIPSLPANASGNITFYTTVYTTVEPVATKSPIFIGNAVKIFSNQSGITGDQDDTVAVVCGPLLELTKIVGPTRVLPGHILAYTITVSNIERQDSIEATNLVITDALPAKTTYLDSDQGSQYVSDANAVVWHIAGPLYPGEQLTLHFRVYVAIDAVTNTSIVNANNAYRARASEIKLADVLGKIHAASIVRPLLEKQAFAATMVSTIPEVFPTEEVTYTITVYNPLNENLTNVALTDTLPGNPVPFTYLRPAYGDPAPTVLNNGRELAWTISSLPAWGKVTRSFVVQIPRQTYINVNATLTEYFNTLNAYHPEAAYRKEINLARVRVKAAMIMEKIVSNNITQPGVTIFYTITLKNVGPFLIDGIRLTDTIQSSSDSRKTHYYYMTEGPNPLPGYDENPIVWQDPYLSVPSKMNLQIAFAAIADGDWLRTYCNGVKASSPDAYIPERVNLACFFLDSPMKINKTVTPSSIYPGGEVEYEITLYNTSLVNETFTLDRIEDTLPSGFYQVGGSNSQVALIPVDPDYPIAPDETWTGSFTARVTTDVGCNLLPRVYWNTTGSVRQYYTTPSAFYAYNATNLAPLTVNPHVLVDLLPYRRTTPPGSVVSYTLSLDNQSADTLTNVNLVLTLPTDLYYTPTYVGIQQGPAPAVNGQTLTWSNLTLPGHTETLFIFTLQIPGAPETPVPPPTRSLVPTWSATASNGCVGRLDTGVKPNGNGLIVVDPYPVTLIKTPITDWVPPDSLVEYVVTVVNKDTYPFVIDSITDIMPNGFSYVSMVIGPEPEVNEETNQLVWRNATIQPGGNSWRIRMRSATLYGEYYNKLAATDNEVTIQSITANPVSVVPSVSIIKRVGVDRANPGSIIPYTVTLINLSEVAYTQIRITDTLPTGFTYVDMIKGPVPASLGPNGTQPVWTGLNLPANCGPNGCKVEIVFRVRIGIGVPTGTYYNLVSAQSNSGSIPNLGETAPVFVTDQPLPPPGSERVYLPILIR